MHWAKLGLLCAVGALAACHGDSPQAAKPAPAAPEKAPVAVKPGPSAAEQTVGMVEAASLGKSQLQVALKFALTQRPVVGQPLGVMIALIPQILADATSVQALESSGLKIEDKGDMDLPAVEASQVYRHSLIVTPTEEGVQLLTLNVTVKHDDVNESRTFQVPIIVGGAPAGGAAKR